MLQKGLWGGLGTMDRCWGERLTLPSLKRRTEALIPSQGFDWTDCVEGPVATVSRSAPS